jgi:hypothetical protein
MTLSPIESNVSRVLHARLEDFNPVVYMYAKFVSTKLPVYNCIQNIGKMDSHAEATAVAKR